MEELIETPKPSTLPFPADHDAPSLAHGQAKHLSQHQILRDMIKAGKAEPSGVAKPHLVSALSRDRPSSAPSTVLPPPPSSHVPGHSNGHGGERVGPPHPREDTLQGGEGYEIYENGADGGSGGSSAAAGVGYDTWAGDASSGGGPGTLAAREAVEREGRLRERMGGVGEGEEGNEELDMDASEWVLREMERAGHAGEDWRDVGVTSLRGVPSGTIEVRSFLAQQSAQIVRPICLR